MSGAKILVIDDERQIIKTVSAVLTSDPRTNFQLKTAQTGVKGLEYASKWKPDLILLDLGLPSLHGFEILRRVRIEQPLTRVCIMSVSEDLHDRLNGFDLGADDYIIKPFSSAELLARVNALLRRSKIINDLCIVHKDICLHIQSQTISRSGKLIRLTRKEFDLLLYLMQRPNEVISRNELLDVVWEGKDRFPNIVDVHIESLRKKIDKPFNVSVIKTAYKLGYFYQV